MKSSATILAISVLVASWPALAKTGPEKKMQPMLTCELLDTAKGELRVRYHFRNTSGHDVLVFNRIPRSTRQGSWASDPELGYVLGIEPGVVHLSKQLVPVPEDIDVESPEVPGVTRLLPGEELSETMRFAWPLVEHKPYGNQKPRTFSLKELRAVQCVVGYIDAEPAPETWKAKDTNGEVMIPVYREPLAAKQRLAVSAPIAGLTP